MIDKIILNKFNYFVSLKKLIKMSQQFLSGTIFQETRISGWINWDFIVDVVSILECPR